MSKRATRTRAYKEITFQQLRSFYETARLGSLTAAAAFLGLAHPTVWQQVHTLEQQLGETLIEPFRRGCRLTQAGQQLMEMVSPAVLTIGSLKNRFQEVRAGLGGQLRVATTLCPLVEESAACVMAFERRYPHIQLTLKELHEENIGSVVESGEADLGLTAAKSADPVRPFQVSPWVESEPAYELDILLLTPKDHPLARRRRIQPRDLHAYPLLNSTMSFSDSAITAKLDQFGLLQPRAHRRIEAISPASIRRYVELGFGIGLVAGLPHRRPHSALHERVMSNYFGRLTGYLLRRKGVPLSQAAAAFMDTVRATLK